MCLRKKISILLLCLFLQAGVECEASPFGWLFGKKKKVEAPAKPVKKETPYEKLMKSTNKVSSNGMFNLHKIDGKLYVEFPLNLLGRDMLIGSTITQTSDNLFGSVGEKPLSPIQVLFTKTDSTIYLRQGNPPSMVSDDDENTKRAIVNSSICPIMEKYPIKAYNPDSTAVMIDMTDFFLSNNESMSPFSNFTPFAMMGANVSKNFEKEKSSLKDIKSYEDNVSIQSQLAYLVTVSRPVTGEKIIDNKPFTVVMTRSIILLPETPLRMRYADPRMNNFYGLNVELGANKGFDIKFIALRWRLEPKDTAAYIRGELVEPIKPIVFYVDNNFPENWKQPIRDAVTRWNKPFEKIGFKNAILAKDFPTDDPNFDPDNLKYSCIRYSPSQIANAMGPSWIDPRSGEIINASVYIYHNVYEILQSWRFVQTAPADPDMRTMKFDPAIFSDCLAYVVSHEVGHCLSLMHNMSASAAVPTDSLRSPSFTQQFGTTYSIMDYARNNYVAQPGDKERGVRLTPPEMGVQDYFAIKWLYAPIMSAKTPNDETPILRKWLDDVSGDPIYRYGPQQGYMYRPDPTCLEEDLGDDPVKASEYGIKNLKYIMANINDWVAKDDVDGRFRLMIYNEILGQYQRYISNPLAMVGGIKMYEHLEGDKWPSYEPIDRETQVRAIKFTLDQIKDVDWLTESDILSFLPVSMDLKTAVQELIFARAMQRSMYTVYSMQRARIKGMPQYTFEDLLNTLNDYVWEPTRKGRSLTMIERKLQSEQLTFLAQSSGLAVPFASPKIALVSQDDNMSIIPDEFKNMMKDYGHTDNHLGCMCESEINKQLALNAVRRPNAVMEDISVFRQNAYAENESKWMGGTLYDNVLKAYDLMKAKMNTGDKATKEHYRLLIHRLDQVLKK